LLPALAQPRTDGALHPELVVVQEFLEELERFVEFRRSDESVERVRRCASSPDALRAGPSKDVSKPDGLLVHHPRDRAGGKTVAQSPTGRLVDPWSASFHESSSRIFT